MIDPRYEATERIAAAVVLVDGFEKGYALEGLAPAQLMYGVVRLTLEALRWAYGFNS